MSNPTSSGGTRLRIPLADDHEPFRKQVRNVLQELPRALLSIVTDSA